MNTKVQSQQNVSADEPASSGDVNQSWERENTKPPFIPASKWGNYYDWPPNGGLRHIIFNEATNGFGPAITRVGGSVLINHKKFWEIVEQGTD